MTVPLRRRQAHRRPLGWLTAAVALALLATGVSPVAPAQAAPTPSPSSSAPSWGAMRYKPAGCNTAEAGDGFARCYALGLSTADGRLIQQVSEPPEGALGPPDIRSAYRLPDGGEGRTVAVVLAFGYEAAEADLAVFREHYDLPPCTTANGCFRKVDQRGGTDYPAEDAEWSIEAALDLDAVSSACPKCDILLVQADDNSPASLGAAVDTAAKLGADVISNSYGIAGETRFQELYSAHYDHPGIAVVVASGDLGNVQSYPATHPDVVAVGGTRLTRDSSARGWSETAWVNAGSGCSLYEPRPAYQAGVDTRCGDKRATADVSAVADPESGLAVYNTLGQDGWAQWGGTSLAAPLVAGMYALAGEALPGSYPVTYPYRTDKSAGLFDITEGSNGWCGDLRCNAGPGWDGPTGVGSPNGVSALTLGEAGRIVGTVTSGRRDGAVAGATITATDGTGATFRAVADANGRYSLPLPAGGYDLVATEFGYQSPKAERVTVAAEAELTRDFTLTALPSRTVTGTVTDASGHGWPVYARIAVDGYPGGAVFTDPYTGRYQVDLPVGSSYTLHVSPVDLPGYVTRTVTTRVDPQPKGRPADVRQDVGLSVDATSCTAPGYAPRYDGVGADFTGWAAGPRDGWRVTDDAGAGQTWRFDDPGSKGNLTGGDGGFAAVDGWSQGGRIDSSLITPPVDLTGIADPVVGFDTDYSSWDAQTGDVDLSLDNGATWTGLRHLAADAVNGHVEIPLPQAAGKSGVLVRFRYQGEYDNWWQLDNVFVGRRSCAPVPGGLVAGQIQDDNTGAAVLGATVSTGGGARSTSQATPDDARLPDGFYWLFAAGSGSVPLTFAGLHYGDSTTTVRIHRDGVVRRDWRLEAGQLAVRDSDLAMTVRPGRSVTREVRLSNSGDRPLRVSLVEQDRGNSVAAGARQAGVAGAPLVRIRTDASVTARAGGHSPRPLPPQQAADGTAWTNLPDYPVLVMDNLVADDDGTVYSVGGSGEAGSLAAGYVFDPQAQAWKRIADLPEPRAAAVGGFVDGRLYAVGGWDGASNAASTTYAYDPGTDRWSRRADLPVGVTAAAAATAGGRLYVVAGCTTGECEPASNRTYRYDPTADRWTRLADYPLAVAFLACAAAGDGVVCAGGIDPTERVPVNDTFRYFADSDTWVRTNGLPIARWGMAYAGAGGKLQVVGGITAGYVTNEALEFDPATDTWSALPNTNNALYRGGAACGLYQVGGSLGSFAITPFAQRLPGHDGCVRGSDVSWLSVDRTTLTIPAGRSVTVTVAARAPVVAGHGEYRARLAFETDTPYRNEALPVVMTLR